MSTIFFFFFFFNDTATTEIYTLSLHDALPISPLLDAIQASGWPLLQIEGVEADDVIGTLAREADRKSTRLNSSHSQISYAVFCLKKKKNPNDTHRCDSGQSNNPPRAKVLLTHS